MYCTSIKLNWIKWENYNVALFAEKTIHNIHKIKKKKLKLFTELISLIYVNDKLYTMYVTTKLQQPFYQCVLQ